MHSKRFTIPTPFAIYYFYVDGIFSRLQKHLIIEYKVTHTFYLVFYMRFNSKQCFSFKDFSYFGIVQKILFAMT